MKNNKKISITWNRAGNHIITGMRVKSHSYFITGHNHGSSANDSHLEGVGKGLMAVTGLFAFFLIERIVNLIKFRRPQRSKSRRLDLEAIVK